LSPFDCCVLTLIGVFPEHRGSENAADATISRQSKFIYNHLHKVLSTDRILAKTDDVVRVTNVMLDNSLGKGRSTRKRGRRHYCSDEDSDDDDDPYKERRSLADIDGADIKIDFLSASELPELPAADSSGDVEMEEEEEEAPEDFNGLTIVLSGSFKKTHEELTALIKKYGGNVSSSVNNTVTHVIASDPEDRNTKLLKAREEGKKIVGEEFLSKILAKDEKEDKKEKKKEKKGKKEKEGKKEKAEKAKPRKGSSSESSG